MLVLMHMEITSLPSLHRGAPFGQFISIPSFSQTPAAPSYPVTTTDKCLKTYQVSLGTASPQLRTTTQELPLCTQAACWLKEPFG